MGQITGWIQNDGRMDDVTLLRMIASSSPAHQANEQSVYQTALEGRFGVAATNRQSLHVDADWLLAWTGNPIWAKNGADSESPGSGFVPQFIHALKNEGSRAFEGLAGRYSIAFLDLTDGNIHLAIDRLGQERLTFARVPGGFLFGTSLDAFRGHPAFSAQVDPQAIYNYLYFHVIPSPRTIYRQAWKLQPGEHVVLQNSDYTVHPGKTAVYDSQPASNAELGDRLVAKLETAVENSIRRRPVAAFLSGGLDSSTVVGMAQRFAPGETTAFCVGFDADGYDEMPFARESARHFGVPLVERYVTADDVCSGIDVIARAYDEPFGNASAVPAFFCAKQARDEGFELILAGDGGDELFAGNARYARQAIFEAYEHVPQWFRTATIEPLLAKVGPDALALLRKIRSYVDQARIPLPERLETYNLLHRFDLHDMLTPELFSRLDLDEPHALLRKSYFAVESSETLRRMLHLDLKFTLADNDIRKVSRMCEWAGIDVAYPLLDDGLVDFSATVPSSVLLQGRNLRAFYKHALKDFLPPHTLTKTKHGFGLPFGQWLSTHPQLRSLAQDSLGQLTERGIIQPGYSDVLLGKHAQENAGYYGVMVWVLIALERWLRDRTLSL